MGSLKASVVISVRNRSVMLADCLRGLGLQSLDRKRFEVVVIDNCSTEDLRPVVEAAREAYGLNIRYDRTAQDRGPAPARNLGVSLAQGEVIAFTDSDCRPVPQWLELALAPFADERLAMVSGPVLPKPEQSARFTSKTSFVTQVEHPTFPTANLLVRTSVFRALQGFDTSLSFRDPLDRATECADTDLAWRIIKAGHMRQFVPEAVMHHELEDQSLLLWMLEPTRLFLLPALVSRHPELRTALLKGGLFFFPPGVMVYAGLLAVGAMIWLAPTLLWLLPTALILRAVQRTGSLQPGVLAGFCLKAPLHVARLMVMNVALLYGSLRFRCLVL